MTPVAGPRARMHALVLAVLAAAGLAAGAARAEAAEAPRLFIVGQDLDSIRAYYDSGCCPVADGATAYLDFYALLAEDAGFGGLGIDASGRPIDAETDWGAGPSSAWKTAREFPGGLAIGLNISENGHPGGLARIVAGELDAEIRQLARFLRMIGEPAWLRIGYEFDGGWNRGYENAERYVAAWRRIVDGLRAAGVANVEFVWQSAAFPLDILQDGGYTDIRRWYPGDDYVDWLGVSMFVGLDEKPSLPTAFDPPTARELLGHVLQLARERGKPVFVAEAAPQGHDLARGTRRNTSLGWDGNPGDNPVNVTADEAWREWYAPLFDWLHENRDVVRALAYINCHWDTQDMWDAPYESGYWGDTRLQASPALAERFAAALVRWRDPGAEMP